MEVKGREIGNFGKAFEREVCSNVCLDVVYDTVDAGDIFFPLIFLLVIIRLGCSHVMFLLNPHAEQARITSRNVINNAFEIMDFIGLSDEQKITETGLSPCHV